MSADARQRDNTALPESDQRLRKLSAHVPGMIYEFVRRPDGTYCVPFTTDAILDIFGCTAADVRDDFTPIVRTIHPDDLALVVDTIDASARNLSVWQCEYRVRLPGREVRWMLGHSTPERLPDGSIVWYGFNTDVTERKRAEAHREKLEGQLRQAQKLEAIGRLAGGVAHDFNNLLTVIRGSLALALEQVPTGAVADFLRDADEAGRRATEVTSQLLAYSRRRVIEPRVLDLNAIVTGLERMLLRWVREDIRVETFLAPDLWPVKVDSSQIEQVVMNLTVNARDAMPGGGRMIIETSNTVLDADYAENHAHTPPGPYVVLSVSDTGTGMDEATREHVFEPFFTTKPREKGTGLGLATVYGIVKQHKGTIEVYSEPGHGSTFKIYLPRAEGVPVAIVPARTPETLPRGDETLLLVEDDPSVADVLRRLLAPLGYSLLSASSAEAAMQVAGDHPGPIHLLISDVVLPGMNGPGLALRLHESRPSLAVLFVSGYTENAIVHGGVLDEGVHFLGKPYTRRALATKIRAVLDGSDTPTTGRV